MFVSLTRSVCGVLFRQPALSSILVTKNHHVGHNPWFSPVMTLKTSAALRAAPVKKKKVDPKRELMVRERLKKKLRKMEKAVPELIPIEDFMTSVKCLDETRERSVPSLSFEESESRAQLLKEWSRYKQEQHEAEMEAIQLALEAQKEALKELREESEELYQAALKPDPLLFCFTHKGPTYTPVKAKYEAPEGKYNDVTKVYTQ
ncbi:39S ribosomal protein L40, mitochondrial [Thalassophryne amazonica]|uniref:39S ribosomal protein L40, mitochondrial n=1 Tax=Thalassophryne amazonica TaxID=390379 RepID=UPI0014723C94|nr:39S ribosomal protein L40, mitochondrial [Thalassophryne amazonica]